MSDQELLQQYVGGLQEAFALLVRRHMDWVYSVAKRRVQDPQMAEDVAQAAFILLARNAAGLSPKTVLPAWLFKAVGHLSQNALRSERRRKVHEQAAAAGAPRHTQSDALSDAAWLIDQSVGELRRKDRQALLLRFYQQQTLREVGQSLGISEEAARKRVTRALEHLKATLLDKNRAPAVALAALQGHWIEPSPAHLAESAVRMALGGLTGTERAVKLAQGVNRMFALAKAKLAIVIALIVLLPSIGLIGWLGGAVRGQSGNPPINMVASDSAPPQAEFVQSKWVIIVLSPDQRRAWAYSVGAGDPWLKFPTPDGPTEPALQPIVSDDVGVVQSGMRVCAFSGLNGKMDFFDLPAGSKATPVVGNGWAWVRDGSRYWAFSAQSGKWHKVDTLN